MLHTEPMSIYFNKLIEEAKVDDNIPEIIPTQIELLKQFCIEHQECIQDVTYTIVNTYVQSVIVKIYLTNHTYLSYELRRSVTHVKLRTSYERSNCIRSFYMDTSYDISSLSSKYKNLLYWFKVSLLLAAKVIDKMYRTDRILRISYGSEL